MTPTETAPAPRSARVVGASGYSGAQLVALLAAHPAIELVGVHGHSTAGQRWGQLHPGLRHLFDGRIQPFAVDGEPADTFAGRFGGTDVVFVALPHGAAARAVARLRSVVPHVVDLSGDLRHDSAATYERWYGAPHPAPELLGEAVYSVPELTDHALLRDAALVSCGGCYASAAQLAAAPILALGPEIASDLVVLTGISGTSGAGRKASVGQLFAEVHGELRPYRVGVHQHTPEIERGLQAVAGRPTRVTFAPVLAPIERGIVVTATIPLLAGHGLDEGALLDIARAYYHDAPLVRVLDPASDGLPRVRGVVGTPFADVALTIDANGHAVIATVAIDNLLKGAASQAVQNMNLVFGWAQTLGLTEAAGARHPRHTRGQVDIRQTASAS